MDGPGSTIPATRDVQESRGCNSRIDNSKALGAAIGKRRAWATRQKNQQPNFADFIAGCRQDRAHENSTATSRDASFDEVSRNPLFQNGATTVFKILQTFV